MKIKTKKPSVNKELLRLQVEKKKKALNSGKTISK